MTTIVHKRGTGIPAADDLAVGEIAIDTSTGTAYTKNNAGEVVPVGGGGGDPDWALVEDNEEGSARIQIGYGLDGDPPQPMGWGGTAVGSGAGANGMTGTAMGFYARADGNTSVAIGNDAQTTAKNSIALGATAIVTKEGEFGIGPKITSVNFSKATVQATDYLDADGNSIIGAGGGGDPDWAVITDGSVALGNNTIAPEIYTVVVGNASSGLESSTSVGYNATSQGMDVSIGAMSRANGRSVAIGYLAEAQRKGISIGEDTRAEELGIAIGSDARAEEGGIALGEGARAEGYEFALGPEIEEINFPNARVKAAGYLDADGNPATVSPSSIVEAFTTLQTAVADEDTVEGIKTALTNALGGLIEKFEGMAK